MTNNRAAKNRIREVQDAAGVPYAVAIRLVEAFDAVLEQERSLTDHGFGVFEGHRLRRDELREQLAVGRDRLRESIAAIVRIHEWLRTNIRPIKTPTASSYSGKHTAERAMGEYVTNGQFIVAALMAGYPMSRPSGPNARFGMSKQDLDRFSPKA